MAQPRFYIRIAKNIYSDPKLKGLTDAEKWAWVALLSLADDSKVPGTLPEPVEDMAYRLRTDEAALRGCIEKLLAVDRPPLAYVDGVLTVVNWEDHQGKKKSPSEENPAVAERMRRYRENLKNKSVTDVTGVTDVTAVTTPQNIPEQNITEEGSSNALGSTSSGGFVENRKVGAASAAKPNPNGKQPDPKKGTRIPEDWEPSDADYEQMRSEFPDLTRPLMADALREFRDYWLSVPGAKGVKLRWGATWRNDIRHKHANGYFARNHATRTADLPINDPAAIRDEHLSRIERTRAADNPKEFYRALLLARRAGIPLTPEDANTLDTVLAGKAASR